MSNYQLNIPETSDMEIIKALIRQNNFDPADYTSLVSLASEAKEFMAQLTEKLKQQFSDDPDGLYYDLEMLLRARDYLATHYARSEALYRAAKKRFLPKTGTVTDKETHQEFDASPYRFYRDTLQERIKSLDNRCTAAKQQQRILEEALKRNLIE